MTTVTAVPVSLFRGAALKTSLSSQCRNNQKRPGQNQNNHKAKCDLRKRAVAKCRPREVELTFLKQREVAHDFGSFDAEIPPGNKGCGARSEERRVGKECRSR